MLSKLKQSKSEGFTIIEIMIVLAIAALIILIVLLAVPALQRSSRNTAIKNDASAIAAAIGEFSSNNDGALPTAANSSYTAATGTVSLNNATGTATTGKVQASDTMSLLSANTSVQTPAAGQLIVDFGTKCPAVVSGTTVTAVASTRSTSIIYAVEQSGANQAKCLAS